MAVNNRGSVLIFVLIFIAFAASTVLLVNERSTKSMEEASEDFYENQANIYAMTAMTAVVEALRDDDNAYDSKQEDWALIPVIEVPYGYISVDIKPVNGKIGINGLASKTEAMAARYMEACNTIAAEMETDSLKCPVVKDYIDADLEVSMGGEEGFTYERNGVSFRTPNTPMNTLYELRLLMGNNEEFAKIKDYFTVYPTDNTININFANKLTLEAFLPELSGYAEDIINYGKSQIYKDPSNIKEAANIPQDIYLKVLPRISVKSTLFYVKTEVTLNDIPRYYHGLITKDGTLTEIVNFTAGLNGHYY